VVIRRFNGVSCPDRAHDEGKGKALLGGRRAAVAGAEVVDVAHASLLQGHRRPSRRHAHDPRPRAALCTLELVRAADREASACSTKRPRARASSCRGSGQRAVTWRVAGDELVQPRGGGVGVAQRRRGGEEGLDGVLWRRDDHCDFTCRSIAAVWMGRGDRRAGGGVFKASGKGKGNRTIDYGWRLPLSGHVKPPTSIVDTRLSGQRL
jgi:hypothetical protein